MAQHHGEVGTFAQDGQMRDKIVTALRDDRTPPDGRGRPRPLACARPMDRGGRPRRRLAAPDASAAAASLEDAGLEEARLDQLRHDVERGPQRDLGGAEGCGRASGR